MDAHKNPNLETTSDNHHHRPAPPSSFQDRKRTQIIKNLEDKNPCFTSGEEDHGGDDVVSRNSNTTVVVVEESGRERLKRHRLEMAGRVWIPEIWEQEDLLKEWIDCSMFDGSLGNKSIMSARTALVQQARSTATVQ